MKIDVKARNEEGEILFDGAFNKKEVGFLLHYAVTDLLMAGVQFNLQEPIEEDAEDPPLRFAFPERPTND